MKPSEFIDAVEDADVIAAIAEAERKTTGELRVFIAEQVVDDPVAAAAKQFERLKMHETAGRNGVLIFVAPKSRNFAIIGDVAVHQRCGQPFWDALAAAMGEHFKLGAFTQGLVHVIGTAGTLLAEHFPASGENPNELSNNIERG